MFRQGQLAVQGQAILLGRNEAGISNSRKFFLHHAVLVHLNYSLKTYLSTTVCPKVPEKSNLPCFSAICAWILKPFNLQIAMMVRFVMMYDIP